MLVRTDMRVLLVVAALWPAIAAAAPCKDKEACTTACEGGDPAACAIIGYTNFQPLTARKVPARKQPVESCDDAPVTCNIYAAHLWSGIGIKQNKPLALTLWAERCSEDEDAYACLSHAKATIATDKKAAIAEYQVACGRGQELACKAAAKIWTQQSGVAGGRYGTKSKKTIPFTIELPAVMSPHRDWTGAWTVMSRNSSGGWPDIEVVVDEAGKLACNGPAKAARSNGAWLEAGWVERACKSVKQTP